MFGKAANDLQQANAADDEYMISDHDLLVRAPLCDLGVVILGL